MDCIRICLTGDDPSSIDGLWHESFQAKISYTPVLLSGRISCLTVCAMRSSTFTALHEIQREDKCTPTLDREQDERDKQLKIRSEIPESSTEFVLHAALRLAYTAELALMS